MTPSPATPGDSSLPSHSICIPRHTPSSGVPRATASAIARSSPPPARSAASPAPKAPTPGNTTRRAAATTAASSVTTTLEPSRLNALVIDARLATPEFTMTTSGIERPLGGRHVVEPGAGDRLLERERRRLEGRFGPVVVVLALQNVDVQREPAGGSDRAEDVRNVLTREVADRLPAQSERHVCVRPPREIHHGACQRLVERRVCPSEAVDTAPVAQGAVERLAQGQRAVFGGVVVVDLEVSLAGERHVESGVAGQRVEQVVEEAEARLHVGLPRAVERERDRDRRFARGASDRCGARGHGSSPSASSVRSRGSLSRPNSAAFPGSLGRRAVSSPRPPAARSTAMTYGLPTAYPTRQPARPQALDNVRSTRTLGRSSTKGVRSSSAYSTYT